MNLKSHFNFLTDEQILKLNELEKIYNEWNAKINLISRKDIQFFKVHHLLHSLALLKFFNFSDGANFLDVGTGGGLPGIPLAIALPNCNFTLIDSIEKKIKVVNHIVEKLQIHNVKTINNRVENINQKFDFILGRAVTKLPDFIKLTKRLVKNSDNSSKGIFYWTGENVLSQTTLKPQHFEVYYLKNIFSDPFFETKIIVYIKQF